MSRYVEIVRGILAYQFGREAADAMLDGEVKVRVRRGRPREVFVDGERLCTVRASDGLASLAPEGARRLHSATEPPEHRVVCADEWVEAVRRGRDLFCEYALRGWGELRPGDECLVVSEDDELLAVGKMRLSGWEVEYFEHGVAVRVRRGL
ncbi:PUA domain-containing protein [Methanopyrus sp.]